MSKKAETYTTWGPVRGCCGHNHRSIRTAVACKQRDYAGCRSQGGYSDRQVCHSEWAHDSFGRERPRSLSEIDDQYASSLES